MVTESINKIISKALVVGQERVVAASQEVLTKQRRAGRRHTLELHNLSEHIVYFGGEDVTVENGMPMLPDERRVFYVSDPNAVYLVAEDECDVRMAEFCSV